MATDYKLLKQQLEFHAQDNVKQFNKIEYTLNGVRDDVKNMRDNHMAHIEKKLEKVVTDVSWLKKFFWIVAASSIGGLIAGLINLFKIT